MHRTVKLSINSESRLIRYNWNTERLAKETAVYAKNLDSPVEAVTHTVAAGTHIVTGALDSLLGDAVRVLQGKDNRLPLKPYSGDAPRLKLDISEGLDSIKNVVRSKGLSLLALPVIAFKTLGDGVADGVDVFAGIHRDKSFAQGA